MAIRGGSSLTSHWPGRRGSICADGELPVENALDALLGFEHKDQVARLNAHLPAETPTGHGDEDRRVPVSTRVANEQDATAMPASDNEATLDHVGDDHQAFRVGQEAFGN